MLRHLVPCHDGKLEHCQILSQSCERQNGVACMALGIVNGAQGNIFKALDFCLKGCRYGNQEACKILDTVKIQQMGCADCEKIVDEKTKDVIEDLVRE